MNPVQPIRPLVSCLVPLTMAFLFLRCSDPVSSDSADRAATTAAADYIPEAYPCQPDSGLLPGNYFHSTAYGLVVMLSAFHDKADSASASHRLLTILEVPGCRPVLVKPLPALGSPDFPYYLPQVRYHHVVGKLAVRGTDRYFLVDLPTRTLQGPFFPAPPAGWAPEDAADGRLCRLEVWEQYLVGWMAGAGTFVADLATGKIPTYVSPIATYQTTRNAPPTTLFLLPSALDTGLYHAVLTGFDPETGSPTLSVLFDQARSLVPNLPAGARNNRFLLLRTGAGHGQVPVAVDMASGQAVNIPDSLANLPTQALLRWLKNSRSS